MNPSTKHLAKGVFATLLMLLFVTLLDVLAIKSWEQWCWKPPLANIPTWWILFWSLEFLCPLILCLILESKIPLLSYIFFIFGIEDTLFYIITEQGIPETYLGIYYLGVFFAPPKYVVLAGNLVAVGLAVTLVYGFRRRL